MLATPGNDCEAIKPGCHHLPAVLLGRHVGPSEVAAIEKVDLDQLEVEQPRHLVEPIIWTQVDLKLVGRRRSTQLVGGWSHPSLSTKQLLTT